MVQSDSSIRQIELKFVQYIMTSAENRNIHAWSETILLACINGVPSRNHRNWLVAVDTLMWFYQQQTMTFTGMNLRATWPLNHLSSINGKNFHFLKVTTWWGVYLYRGSGTWSHVDQIREPLPSRIRVSGRESVPRMWHLLAHSGLSEWPLKQVTVYLIHSVLKTSCPIEVNT